MGHTKPVRQVHATKSDHRHDVPSLFVDAYGTYEYLHYMRSAGHNALGLVKWSNCMTRALENEPGDRITYDRLLVINSQVEGSKMLNGAKEEFLKDKFPENNVGQTKDTNPKDGIGATKLPLSLVPPVAIAHASLAHLDGACKYGKWNWRIAGVRASIYIDAALRHITAYNEGEEIAADSGVHHLGHALACLNILLDAASVGKLIDDRPPSGFIDSELTKRVASIKKNHEDKSPRHYSIQDTDHGLDRNSNPSGEVSPEA